MDLYYLEKSILLSILGTIGSLEQAVQIILNYLCGLIFFVRMLILVCM